MSEYQPFPLVTGVRGAMHRKHEEVTGWRGYTLQSVSMVSGQSIRGRAGLKYEQRSWLDVLRGLFKR